MSIQWRCGECFKLNTGQSLTEPCSCGFVGGPLVFDDPNRFGTEHYEVAGHQHGSKWAFDLFGPGMNSSERWIGVSLEAGADLAKLLERAFAAGQKGLA